MKSFMPIPKRLLPHDINVRVPDGKGGFNEPVTVRHVAVQMAQSVCDDEHRSAAAGSGTVFLDAMNSDGAFDVPAGSRVELQGHSYYVTESAKFETVQGQVHHWELSIR